MSIPPDEIAAELQGKMVIDDKTGQKAYYVGELFKLYNSTEGADALQNNLAACGMSLAQLLAEFTDMFSRVGDNSWRAVKTGQFQTILNSQDGGGGARRKTRGGAFGGGGGGGRGYMRGGRGSNIPRAGRPGGAGFKPGVNLLRNRNPSTSSNSTFGSAFHQNPQRAPYVGGRGGFQNTVSNNQRAPDNTWFWNGGNNYNNDNIGRPQRNDNRFFNDGGRRRSPSPSPPPPRQRGYSPSPSPPPTRQSYASYDSHEPDYRHRRFSPSPEPYDSRDNSRPPSRTRTNRTRDDDNYVHRQPNRIPPNEPSRDDLMNMSEFSRFSSDDSFHSMDPDPRNRSNPRNIEDLANRFNAAVVSVPVVTTAPPPGLHLNLNVNASTPTPTPSTSKAPPPPPPPRPAPTDLPALQVNEITYRQAKKCKKAFKRLDEPRVHLTELIAAVETEMKGELPGGNNRGKTEYLERLQKSFPEVLRAIRINKEEGTATKISPPSQPHVEPDDEVTGIIRLYLENKRSTKLIQTKVLSDLEILTEKSVSELVPKLLAVFESEPGKYTWVDEVSSSSTSSAPPPPPSDTNLPQPFRTRLEHSFCSFMLDTKQREVEITKFRNFSRFLVRFVEDLDEFEMMDKKLQSVMADQEPTLRPIRHDLWRPNHGCVLKEAESGNVEKWVRGVVMKAAKSENDLVRVLIIDIGHFQMVDATRIFPLPPQFAETPPFAVPCTLAAEEGTLDDLENEIFRWRTIFADNLAGKCYIKRAGGGSCDITDNGVKACGVHLFITVLGKPKSVVDVNL